MDEEDVVVRDLADFEGPSTAIGSLAPGAPGPSGLPPRRRGNVTLEETDSETDTEYDMWSGKLRTQMLRKPSIGPKLAKRARVARSHTVQYLHSKHVQG